ncbi:MAG: UvrB/UvrC motif-containing protein [Planctomycetes bacterium]|nr:UvrB/UvrC motif-containing protein [Planctomycetota bacterium]
MSLDINHILNEWPYEPGQVNVRRIRGEDGREKIQLRLDLGLLQMEVAGRPDGQRPHGHECLLAYYEHQLQRFRQDNGADEGFKLDEQACELLRAEGLMYYHRYVAEFVLEDFEAVERDTMRNIRMFDLCRKYAAEESDRLVHEQYRPYVIMMCTRARARIALRDNRPRAALAALRKGIEDIQDFFRSLGQEKLVSGSGELALLRAMAKEIESSIPMDPLEKLRKQLAQAVKDERYEDAAGIRDEMRKISGDNPDASAQPGETG